MCSIRTSLPLRRIFWQVNAVRALKTLTLSFPLYIEQLEAFFQIIMLYLPKIEWVWGIHFDDSFRFFKHDQYE